MNSPKRAVVKVYNWRQLVRLILDDLSKHGMEPEPGNGIHYWGTLDTQGQPLIRIDLTPVARPKRNKKLS